ncbi:MAG: anticodon-binding protein [Micrococcales bacterium]|nr:anticodon-binding protein [Micrococcales bacterium]
MTPEALRRVLEDVAAHAARIGDLPDEAEGGAPAGSIFRPVDGRMAGVVADWVTPVARRWAPDLDLSPAELATVLAQGLVQQRHIDAVEVAPSGLLAITLDDRARAEIIRTVEQGQATYALEPSATYSPIAAQAPGSRLAEDPVARAQRAHARMCRLIRNAEAVGVEVRSSARIEELTHVSERLLLVALADLPQRLGTLAGDGGQQARTVGGLGRLADTWTHPLRPERLGEALLPIFGARLALARATRIVLRNGLARLGAHAPERM